MPIQAKTGITGTFWGEDSATVAPIESAEQSLRELDQMIKELNLDVNLKTSNGETPLLLVCSDVKENVGVVKALLDNGANINEPVSILLGSQCIDSLLVLTYNSDRRTFMDGLHFTQRYLEANVIRRNCSCRVERILTHKTSSVSLL